MPQYMTQFAYTADAWASLTRKPTDRSKAVAALAKKLGGKLSALYYTMGDYDGVLLYDAPDDSTAMAIILAAVTPGHIRASKTTRLYTPGELVDALGKTQGVTYEAPKG